MKSLIWLGLVVGSTLGSMIPLIWGGSELSMASVLLGALGGMAGIYAGYRLGRW